MPLLKKAHKLTVEGWDVDKITGPVLLLLLLLLRHVEDLSNDS